jgi:hypothetical protein
VNVLEALKELERQGFSLTVMTRVEVTHHKLGTVHTTYGGKIRLRGPEAPPDELRQVLIDHPDEAKAALCVLDPPVPWIAELVRRADEGRRMETTRLVPYVKRDKSVGLRTEPVTTVVGPETLAANIASFIGLSATHDRARLEPVVCEALSRRKGAENNGAA